MSTVLDYPFNCASQWPNQHNHSHYMLVHTVHMYIYCSSFLAQPTYTYTYVQYIYKCMYVCTYAHVSTQVPTTPRASLGRACLQ